MKYLAILKDSFREAIDTKVFSITAAVSCAVVLGVSSVSFRPLPAQEALQEITSRFGLVFAGRGQGQREGSYFTVYEVTDVHQSNVARRPQMGDYHFALRVYDSEFRDAVAFWNSPTDAEDSGGTLPATLTDLLMEEFIKSQFALHGNVEVKELQRLPSRENDIILFRVQTKGASSMRGWPHEPCLLFGAFSLPVQLSPEVGVFWIEDSLVNGVGAWVGILVGIVITAFFIPNMLQKGTQDLLLAKPVCRTMLLVYKYLGGLTFVFLNAALAVAGIWLAVGLRTGIWATGFLLSIFVITFFFAILYAVSTLVAVWTRSGIVAILLTCLVWFFLWMVGLGYTSLNQSRPAQALQTPFNVPAGVCAAIDLTHFLLPRAKDLDVLTTRLLSEELLTKGEIRQYKIDAPAAINWGESLTGSLVFIGVMLGLSARRFATRDY